MSKKIYTINAKDISVLISAWQHAKPVSEKCVKEIKNATRELRAYINERTPLSNHAYGQLSNFRRMNLMMSPYISKLPDYLKQIDSGITPSPVDNDTIERLSSIAYEANIWKEAYNKAVAEYKTIQPVYLSTFYSNNGTFDFANWI